MTLTFAVLGASRCGKTGFVNNALEQQKSTGTPLSSSKVSLGGSLYRVQLVEITFDDADFASTRRVIWPKYLNNIPFPSVQGAFCLFDVTDDDSVAQVPQALSKCDGDLFAARHLSEILLWNGSCILVRSPCQKDETGSSHCRISPSIAPLSWSKLTRSASDLALLNNLTS